MGKHDCLMDLIVILAERGGFEPPLPCDKHDFESCAFDHSAISPGLFISGAEARILASWGSGIRIGYQCHLEPPMGLEPTTYALRVRCSTD